MSLFISVRIDHSLCDKTANRCLECVTLCPVAIFSERENRLVVNKEREDECILCELCLQAAPPGAIQIVKLYSDVVLMRRSDS